MAADKNDHYELLWVSRDAPTAVIIDQYYARVAQRQVKHIHYGEPTAQEKKDGVAKLAELHAAVKVLSNPISRDLYDKQLREMEGKEKEKDALPRFKREETKVDLDRPRRRERSRSSGTPSSGSRSSHYRRRIYPDTWTAGRDGRVRSNGRSWRAPSRRSRSPAGDYYRPTRGAT